MNHPRLLTATKGFAGCERLHVRRPKTIDGVDERNLVIAADGSDTR